VSTTGFAILFFCTAYLLFGRRDFFMLLNANGQLGLDAAVWGGPYQCAAAVAALLLPALLLARLYLKIPFAAMGFALGNWKLGLSVALPVSVLAFPVMWLATDRLSPLCGFYPLSGMARDGVAGMAAWLACYAVYYVAWEGLFRGVIQLGLKNHLGVLQCMLLQTALSTLLHAGHPEMETFGALVAGPMFGLLALRTGSIYYVLLLHFALGAATDIACVGATA
jgi:membrane protease YdiL (CAAX protease family)